MKVYQGSIHQGDLSLINYGKLCCPASVTACFMAMFVDPKKWQTTIINECVEVRSSILSDDFCQYIVINPLQCEAVFK